MIDASGSEAVTGRGGSGPGSPRGERYLWSASKYFLYYTIGEEV